VIAITPPPDHAENSPSSRTITVGSATTLSIRHLDDARQKMAHASGGEAADHGSRCTVSWSHRSLRELRHRETALSLTWVTGGFHIEALLSH
jgi:hypothetical protein